MITETENAWMLHKTNKGETSLWVRFFTKEWGIIQASYRGGRLPKKQALLQAFTPTWVSFESKRDWVYVKRLESRGPTIPFPNKNVFAAWYVNELLCLGLKPIDPCDVLYDAYTVTMRGLSDAESSQALEQVLRQFEWSFLTALGLNIDWTCEAQSTRPIVPEAQYALVLGEGFVQQAAGLPGKSLLAMAQGALLEPDDFKTVKWIMRRLISHALDGKVIKARGLY